MPRLPRLLPVDLVGVPDEHAPDPYTGIPYTGISPEATIPTAEPVLAGPQPVPPPGLPAILEGLAGPVGGATSPTPTAVTDDAEPPLSITEAYMAERPVYDARRARTLGIAGLVASVAGLGIGAVTGRQTAAGAIAQGIAGGAGETLGEMEDDHAERTDSFMKGLVDVTTTEAEVRDRQAGREVVAETATLNRESADARAAAAAEAAAEGLRVRLEADAEKDRLDTAETQAKAAWEVGDVDAYTRIMVDNFDADEGVTRSAVTTRAAEIERGRAIQDRDYQLRARSAATQEGQLAVSQARLDYERTRPRATGGRTTGGTSTPARRGSTRAAGTGTTATPPAARTTSTPPARTARAALQDGGRLDGPLDRVAAQIQRAPEGRRRAALQAFLDSLADDVAAGSIDQDAADTIEDALLARLGY